MRAGNHFRSVLALNLGSTTLRAASSLVRYAPGCECPAPLRTGLISLEPTHDPTGMLSDVAADCRAYAMHRMSSRTGSCMVRIVPLWRS